MYHKKLFQSADYVWFELNNVPEFQRCRKGQLTRCTNWPNHFSRNSINWYRNVKGMIDYISYMPQPDTADSIRLRSNILMFADKFFQRAAFNRLRKCVDGNAENELSSYKGIYFLIKWLLWSIIDKLHWCFSESDTKVVSRQPLPKS